MVMPKIALGHCHHRLPIVCDREISRVGSRFHIAWAAACFPYGLFIQRGEITGFRRAHGRCDRRVWCGHDRLGGVLPCRERTCAIRELLGERAAREVEVVQGEVGPWIDG